MNIYEKLLEARVRFQEAGVRMSGHNSFAKYDYYDLADILPRINLLAKELKFFCSVSFNGVAELKVTDAEKPEDSVVFASPLSTAALKGCHEVQNLGAVETYLKRYLYQNAFEIVEHDALDGGGGPPSGNGREAAKKPAPGKAPAPGKKPGWASREQALLVDEISEVMKAVDRDGEPLFSKQEKESVWRQTLAAGTDPEGAGELRAICGKWRGVMERREKEGVPA